MFSRRPRCGEKPIALATPPRFRRLRTRLHAHCSHAGRAWARGRVRSSPKKEIDGMKPVARLPGPPPLKKLSKNPADPGDGSANSIHAATNPAATMSTPLHRFAVIDRVSMPQPDGSLPGCRQRDACGVNCSSCVGLLGFRPRAIVSNSCASRLNSSCANGSKQLPTDLRQRAASA